MLEMLKKYRKYALGAYFLLCVIYCILRISIPEETTQGRGLEDLGRRQIVERTAYLNEGDQISFTLPVENEPLNSIGFFLNTDSLILDGVLRIRVTEKESGTLLADSSILLDKIQADQFVQTKMDHFTNGTVLVELTVEDSLQGPRFWLNSTTETEAQSWYNGTEMKYPLVYNAGFSVMTRDFKGAVITTLMAMLFGLVLLLVSDTASKKEKQIRQQKIWMRLKEFYGKYKVLLGGALVVGVVAVLFFYVYDTQIRIVMNTTERTEVISASEPETLLFQDAEAEIVQLVTCEEETLTGLGVMLYVPEEAVLSGSLKGTVTDLTTGEVLCESVLDMTQAMDGEYMNFLFSHEVKDTSAHTYEIRLVPSEELKATGLGIYTTEEGELLTQAHKYFNIFLKKYFFFMFVGAELFAVLFYWMVFMKKCRIETTVLVSLLFLGLLYNFLLLPYMAPDEEKHLDMTYRFSNDLLGIDYIDDITLTKRVDDTKYVLEPNAELSNYYTVYHHLLEPVQDESLIVTNASVNIFAPFFVYFPAVLGMTLARLLGFGTIAMLMFARWCNLAFFAVCVWWCMKKLPFGKMALAVIALFPMTIQQCNSFSYDAVITSVLFLFSTYVICMTYEDRPLRVSDVAVLAVLSALLVYGKSGVYFPVCLAVLLIPTKKFGALWKKYAVAGGLLGIGFLSYINRNSGTVTQVVTTTAETSAVGGAVGNAVDMGYTLGYFLQNPWKLIQMLANTVADKAEFYLESIVGQKMGWVEIEISRIVVIGFFVLFFLTMCKVRGEKQYVTAGQKWWVAIVCLLSAGMILMGMLLSWTPFGHVSIEGVQGRYFTPLLLLASLLGRNGVVLLNENRDRELLLSGVLLQIVAVIYLIKALIVIS